MASNIPISTGSGAASVATEQIGANQYQQVKVVGGEVGSTSVWGIAPDRSALVSVVGTVNVNATGTPSISGAVNVAGSVMLGSSNASVITVSQNSSIIAVPTGNQSVSGAVQIYGNSSLATVHIVDDQIQSSMVALVTDTIIHGRTTGAGGGYVEVKVDPSGAIVTAMSSVVTFQGGAWRTSVISSTPSSMLAGASIFGQLPGGTAVLGSIATLQGTTPWIINGSVSGALFVSGSVMLGSSNASVITYIQNSSLIAINAGSVVTLSQGSVITVAQAPSIVGTYLEDAAHATGDRGIFVMQVRNDNMTSVTSADGDYSPIAGGPVGETIVANAPITKWVQGTADLRGASTGGPSIAVIAAQGASIFTYITGLQVVNMGSASVLVTLSGATSSIIGYTIAPAGGGSNIVYPNALKTNANAAFAASISGIASVIVSAQGFTAKI